MDADAIKLALQLFGALVIGGTILWRASRFASRVESFMDDVKNNHLPHLEKEIEAVREMLINHLTKAG